ncbi:hypothetical protein FF1_019104 [Malus domestica]|uniref:Pterin-binding domain-containing protein n=1 Tax=Malus domestica TaxID=3750 RepID=A0A498I390_MALDO|nr:hypothetical protein DVH24_039232 [Malus domestica]
MATINIFQNPYMPILHKSQLLHTSFAYQRSSSTKIPCDHQSIRRNHQKLVTLVTHASDKSQPDAQLSADDSPLSSWKTWIVGLMLTIIIPSLRHKWGPLLALKSKVDTAVDTVESVTEVVEELAEQVEKVAEQVEDKLPEDAKLRDAMESIEHLAEEAVKKAELAKDVIHKVEEVEEEVEKALLTGSDTTDPAKGEKGQKST